MRTGVDGTLAAGDFPPQETEVGHIQPGVAVFDLQNLAEFGRVTPGLGIFVITFIASTMQTKSSGLTGSPNYLKRSA